MAAALTHRGPDAEAVVGAGPATLGHRRLSIIDVAHGAQPMYSSDRRWVLSYNGELYNYLEVRAELQRLGAAFRTECDTEVVVEAFAAWGPHCLERFNGEFGIAAYDAHEGVLHIARDRLGIRNMYYAQTAETVVFASEAKALFASGLVFPEVDPSCLSDFLALRYVPAPQTGFRNVTCLAPGHRAEVRADGLTIVRYWEVAYEPDPRLQDESRVLEEVEELLLDAVRVRLMSDVPFGAYLSGGVDSSLIVAMMSRMLDRPVRTFTAGFQSTTEMNEVPFAAAVAKHTGADHAFVECGPEDLADNLARMVWHSDVPMADPASIPTFLVSRLAGASVRMVLTGEGSDELFGGYPKYVAEKMLRWVPAAAARAIPWPKSVTATRKGLLFKQVVTARDESERLMLWFGNIRDAGERRGLLHADVRSVADVQSAYATVSTLLQRASGWDAFSRMAYVDLKTWLPDDLLLRADRMCMAWSVEGRVPFLDHRLVELLARVPSRRKLPGLQGKPLLKKIAEKYLPYQIVHRKKVGFAVPLAEWMRGPLRSFAYDTLTSRAARERGLLDQGAVRALLEAHRAGTTDNSREIWSLLVLETWANTTWSHTATFPHTETGGL